MNPAKKLIILRHGQAKNASAGEADSGRHLTQKGSQDAENAGKKLLDLKLTPNLAICSPSVRTSETLEEVQKSFSPPLITEYVQKIYHAYDRDLLALIAATPENVQTLLLVGHNPALHQLTTFLAKTGDEKLIDELHLQFPPCSMAVLSINSAWRDIKNANSELMSFFTPEMA